MIKIDKKLKENKFNNQDIIKRLICQSNIDQYFFSKLKKLSKLQYFFFDFYFDQKKIFIMCI